MPEPHAAGDLLDLAYPYALDALPEDERRAVEDLLARTDESTAAVFRAMVRELRETLASMTVVDAVPAPPNVEETLQRALDAEADAAAPPSHRHRGVRWLAAAAAIAVVLGVGAGITVYRNQSHDDGSLTALQVRTHADARAQTLPVTGGGTVEVSVSRELRAAVVSFETVPAPPAAHTYQLWLIAAGGPPESAGVFDTLPGNGSPLLIRIGDAGQLAVSIEPAGGSQAPTTSPIVGVTLS